MRTVIIAGSELSGSEGLPPFMGQLHEVELVVVADGGGNHLDLLDLMGIGSTPLILVGDMDSISAEAREALERRGAEVRLLPTVKNETDLEFALKVAREQGADDIVVLAALGGPRIDHLLGTVVLLSAPWLAGCRVRLVDSTHEVFLACGDVEVQGAPGDLLSLIPLTSQVENVTTEGLRYALRGEDLQQGSTRGVSNELSGTRAKITHGSGDLLVVHYRAREVSGEEAQGTMACQFSLYPLRQPSLDAALRGVVDAAPRCGAAAGLTVRVQTLSTLMQGPKDTVFQAARAAFDGAATLGSVVMVCAFTLGSPSPAVVEDIQQKHVDVVRGDSGASDEGGGLHE